MNSANRQKLLQEYADQNRRPLQMKINNEAVIIPVEYTLSGSAEEIQKIFWQIILISRRTNDVNTKKRELRRGRLR